LFGLLFGLFFLIIIFAVFSVDLPDPNTLLRRSDELSTKLYDQNGKPIFEVYGEKNRSLIELDDISPFVNQATLAVEDANFYEHQGFDFRGMLRAVKNTVTGQGLQGGSTITQQVVKNALLTQDRTITRKIKELILALQLENRYTKDEILQMYLNETPYGGQNYGVLTASRAYFDKEPSELTLAESAFLAGIPQRPSYYLSDPALGLERKDYVLFLMKENGWQTSDGTRHFLNEEDYDAAKEEIIEFTPPVASFKAPHFVFYVKQQLAEMYGEEMVEQGGLQVTTSLDLDVQEMAEEVVFQEVEASKGLNVWNGSLVSIDPKTGHIIAMVGSKGYFLDPEPEGCVSGITGENSCTFDPQVNVTTRERQPGSSIKPVTYATMLSQGYIASTPLIDVPTNFREADAGKDYLPQNYDGNFRGPMSLRKSLGNSINISAVKALQIVGIENMIKTAQKLGISTFDEPSRYGLSLTLGGGETMLLEMTNAFAAFGAKGVYREPVAILEVKNARGDVLYKWRDSGGSKAVGEDVAFLISDILSDDGARSEVFGFGSLLNIPGHQVAVKTGTTDDKRDNYFMAYTPSISTGVWVGNNNNDPMNPYIASGITGATPIGNRFMRQYLSDKEVDKFVPPLNVKKMLVDELTGMLPYDKSGLLMARNQLL
jgi:membrane peptidoglycan carboxypeptidase